jgi:hypothetical protein
MPKSITIETVSFNWPVSEPQTVAISHKKTVEPDTTFITDTTTQLVNTNGELDPAFTIENLDFDTRYTIRVSPVCGDGQVAYLTLQTGINPCPNIERVYGTVY